MTPEAQAIGEQLQPAFLVRAGTALTRCRMRFVSTLIPWSTSMKIAAWLDQKQQELGDVSQIELPREMLYDEEPDEVIYFKEQRPCTFLCSENHPFSKVARYKDWYYATGQDKSAGIHSSEKKWRLVTKDKALALKTAQAHIE